MNDTWQDLDEGLQDSLGRLRVSIVRQGHAVSWLTQHSLQMYAKELQSGQCLLTRFTLLN